MNKELIWDVPIRVFHGLFSLACAGSLAIALIADDDSRIFPLHMLLGITACFMLIIRLALAIFGNGHNRFKAMFFSPKETFRYLLGSVTGKTRRYFVHNPGSAAAAIGMFILVLLLAVTGVYISQDWAEETHEVFAYALLALIVLHLAGLAMHSIRYRENVLLSMVSGYKQGPQEESLRSSNPIFGVIILLIVVIWIGGLAANYDSEQRTVKLPVLGSTIQLGENEHAEREHEGRRNNDERRSERANHEDRDDD